MALLCEREHGFTSASVIRKQYLHMLEVRWFSRIGRRGRSTLPAIFVYTLGCPRVIGSEWKVVLF